MVFFLYIFTKNDVSRLQTRKRLIYKALSVNVKKNVDVYVYKN